MATLHVENFPNDLYEALRKRARIERRSISAEVITLLEQVVPTEAQLKKRRELFNRILKLHADHRSDGDQKFPSTEEMIREDRER
jgi:antitoxin FitA